MKKWTSHSGYTRLVDDHGVKLCELNPNTVMDATGEVKILNGIVLERVVYFTDVRNDGWVESAKVEEYRENYKRDCVNISAIQTPSKQDAEQYVFWKSYKQTNMCGELSVCYLLNISLAHLLERWEVAHPTFWQSVFGIGKARGTGESELVKMFELFDVNAKTLQTNYRRYTPYILEGLLGAILGVKISGSTGRLASSGIGHWVVLTDVLSERVGYGLVEIYNPFPNRVEVYSYAEFLASAKAPLGAKII